MKDKVFLDTNVLMDWLDHREGFEMARTILGLGVCGKFELQASVLTMANAAYLYGRKRPVEDVYEKLNDLNKCLDVVPVSAEAYLKALDARWRDFEDALQHFSAVEADAECIVTRNGKDYSDSNIPVMTPEEFLYSKQ